MTKFRDLSPEQKEGIKELLLIGVERRIKEEIDYTNQIYRLLILGNGAGIALLTTFMGAILSSGNPIIELVSPLWKFLAGATFAALIYLPLMAVASQATIHNANQFSDFIQDKIDLEAIQGWGLSSGGRILILLFLLTSVSMFFWGVAQCITILASN